MEYIPVERKRSDSIHSNYTVRDELGRGSFSIVYKAIRKNDHKSFAVKVIDKIKLGVKKLEMIETEINLMKAVKGHPNIINLEEVYETNNEVFIVMEQITGGELFDKIVELQYYTENEASRLIKQILSAVEHLHKRDIVHRDLKPENLLLSSNHISADIKLADFGLSCFLPTTGKLMKAVGTPGYIAPEILQTLDEDLDGYGKEVDVWSVGVIMYILLCGFPPFYAEDDDEAFDQIIAGKFEYPEPYWTGVSPQAKDLIDHLLVVDASSRYTVKQALSHPWVVSNQSNHNLTDALVQLKKFHAKKKWKKGMNAILAVNKLKQLSFGSSPKKLLEDKSRESVTSIMKVESTNSMSGNGLQPSSSSTQQDVELKYFLDHLPTLSPTTSGSNLLAPINNSTPSSSSLEHLPDLGSTTFFSLSRPISPSHSTIPRTPDRKSPLNMMNERDRTSPTFDVPSSHLIVKPKATYAHTCSPSSSPDRKMSPSKSSSSVNTYVKSATTLPPINNPPSTPNSKNQSLAPLATTSAQGRRSPNLFAPVPNPRAVTPSRKTK